MRRALLLAPIVKISALEAWRQIGENTHQLVEERFGQGVEDVGNLRPNERRAKRGLCVIDSLFPRTEIKLRGPVPFESPVPDLAILGDAMLEALVGQEIARGAGHRVRCWMTRPALALKARLPGGSGRLGGRGQLTQRLHGPVRVLTLFALLMTKKAGRRGIVGPTP
jgi:hypothetical protein